MSQVRDADQIDALVARTVETYGGLDCACNNSGIEGKIMPLIDPPIGNYDRIMAVNARGTFLCMQAEIAQMLKTGAGAIVWLSSPAASFVTGINMPVDGGFVAQ